MDIQHIIDFLPCATPESWVVMAARPQNLTVLLVDHANCELKAAQQAQAIIMRYKASGAGDINTLVPQLEAQQLDRLLNMLSRLAREELRHFEQVLAIMKKRDIGYLQLSASRYAGELRQCVRKTEPGRFVDTLLACAIIEARSCERFAAVTPVLDTELAAFYGSLLKSESRHYLNYLKVARKAAGAAEVEQRLGVLLDRERELIEGVDGEFRFHSGAPG